MPKLNRRTFLAASGALAARPAFAAITPELPSVDVVIVGGGAAGIAAARRLAANGRRYLLLEASDHIGGRCITDTRTFGVPFDRGAHWIHMPDVNPLTKLVARGSGLDVYSAPPNQKVRIGRRNAREGELEDFLSFEVRSKRAIADATRKTIDVSCAQALPSDLGEWRPTIEFVLGPYGCGKELGQVSALDFSRSVERDVDAFCRQGLGGLLAWLATGLTVQLSTPVTGIDWRQIISVETPRGTITTFAVIVTVSTTMLASGSIKFTPPLPKRHLDACEKLSLGSYDHIALELVGNPLGLRSDELVFEKTQGTRTAALLGNVSGSPLCLIEVAGKFGRELAAQGEAEMIDFAVEWLAGLYGADIRKAVRRKAATRWNEDAWTRGAFSAAPPGGQPSRRILMEPLREAVWFAGEAAHESFWGTVGGAWESGERAADAVLRRLSLREASPGAAHKTLRRRTTRPEPRREAFPSIMRNERR